MIFTFSLSLLIQTSITFADDTRESLQNEKIYFGDHVANSENYLVDQFFRTELMHLNDLTDLHDDALIGDNFENEKVEDRSDMRAESVKKEDKQSSTNAWILKWLKAQHKKRKQSGKHHFLRRNKGWKTMT